MPRYKVTNRETGETTIIERASPPTPDDQQELQESFARQRFMNPPVPAQPNLAPPGMPAAPLVAQSNPLVQQFDLSPTQTASTPAPAPNAAVSAPATGSATSPLQVVGDAASYWSRSPLVQDVAAGARHVAGTVARGAQTVYDTLDYIPSRVRKAALTLAGRYGPDVLRSLSEPLQEDARLVKSGAGMVQSGVDFGVDQAFQHAVVPAANFFKNYVLPPDQAEAEASSPALAMPVRPPAAATTLTNGRGSMPIYLNAPRDPVQRQADTIYLTPAGPMQWTGKGWVKPSQ